MEYGDLMAKYKRGTLTSAELEELRQMLDRMSDTELEAIMEHDWMAGEVKSDDNCSSVIARIKDRLDKDIRPQRQHRKLVYGFARWAAVIVIPVLALLAWQLHSDNQRILNSEVVVMTQKGEKARIILPDNSMVSLNYETSLSYSPRLFHDDTRQITFNGEAYFEIAKDGERPFVICTPNMVVTVLGTVFNLLAREHDDNAVLMLIDGSVELSSVKTHETVKLEPSDRATLDYASGEIIVESQNDISVPWKSHMLTFDDETLGKVIKVLEANYNCTIAINDSVYINDGFTGTLPANDINLALDIISNSFNGDIRKLDSENYLMTISAR